MVKAARKPDLAATVQVRTHSLTAGIEPKLGGADEGPNPHELLEAALAACTVITVQMYANRKKWKLEAAEASVRIVEEKPEGARISLELSLRGELDAEQRARLAEIADLCPIHKLLTRPISVVTTIVTPEP